MFSRNILVLFVEISDPYSNFDIYIIAFFSCHLTSDKAYSIKHHRFTWKHSGNLAISVFALSSIPEVLLTSREMHSKSSAGSGRKVSTGRKKNFHHMLPGKLTSHS